VLAHFVLPTLARAELSNTPNCDPTKESVMPPVVGKFLTEMLESIIGGLKSKASGRLASTFCNFKPTLWRLPEPRGMTHVMELSDVQLVLVHAVGPMLTTGE
jgi:hypothetical protein